MKKIIPDGYGVVVSIIGFALFGLVAVVGALVLHFFIGLDLPVISASNVSTASYWGQFGDFVGGFLNPVLSFLALIAVVLSLRSQSAELVAAREEAQSAQSQQKAQTEIFGKQSNLIERQNFENVYFGLFDLHFRNIERFYHQGAGAASFGIEGIIRMAIRYNVDRVEEPEDLGALEEFSTKFYNNESKKFGSYFRMIFRIYSYADSYGRENLSPFSSALKKHLGKYSPVRDSPSKSYADIYTDLLSSGEIELIALYCLTPEGAGLKEMCEKYGILRYHPLKENLKYLKARFEEGAFT